MTIFIYRYPLASSGFWSGKRVGSGMDTEVSPAVTIDGVNLTIDGSVVRV